ncbi:MAG: DUF5724 domain-containing protein [Prosthecobacter sp.]
MPEMTDLPDEEPLIQAVLDRRKTADKELSLVVEGALTGNDFLSSRYPFRKNKIEWLTPEQLSRRLKGLGEARMPEVFAILAPDLKEHSLAAWKRMRSNIQRFEHGFHYPHIEGKRGRYEGWWLKEFFQDMTRFPFPPAKLAELAGRAEIGNKATDGAADYLAAAALSAGEGNDTVVLHLKAGLRGEIRGTGVTRLIANTLVRLPRRDGWEALRDALLNAGPEENVIETILSRAHEGSDEAFLFLAETVRSHELLRWPAALRAFNGWLGFSWKASQLKQAQASLQKFCQCLHSKQHRADCIASGDSESLYMALWIEAREDVEEAVRSAASVLQNDPDKARRFAAVHVVSQMKCDACHQLLCEAMMDADLAVACHSVDGMLDAMDGSDLGIDLSRLQAHCDNLLQRVSKAPKAPMSLVWPWIRVKASLARVKDLRPDNKALAAKAAETEAATKAPDEIEELRSIDQLRTFAANLPGQEAETFWREQLIGVSRKYETLFHGNIRAMFNSTHDSDECSSVDSWRDLHRAIMHELVASSPDIALRAAQDWLSQDEEIKLKAGMELLKRLCAARQHVSECKVTAQGYLNRKKIRGGPVPSEITDVLRASPEADEAWEVIRNLVDPSKLTEPAQLVHHDIAAKRPTARLIVEALDNWLWERRERMISVDEGEPRPLFEHYGPYPRTSLSLEDDLKRLPLAAELRQWWESRPASLIDPDGLELWRASLFVGDGMAFQHEPGSQIKRTDNFNKAAGFVVAVYGTRETVRLHPRSPVENFLAWLRRMHPPGERELTFLLDVLENRQLAQQQNPFGEFWSCWMCCNIGFDSFPRPGAIRLWHAVIRALTASERGVHPSQAMDAHAAGLATDSDLAFYILGQTDPINRQCLQASSLPHRLRTPANTLRVMDACAALVVEHELNHPGPGVTLFGNACAAIRSVKGAHHALKAMALLGEAGPLRLPPGGPPLRRTLLTHILKVAAPAEGDTPLAFATEAKQLALSERSLVTMAVFAPVWAPFVEHVLDATGFADAVWWLHAHSRGSSLFDEYRKEGWRMEVGRRSDVSVEDFEDGTADVAWFHRIHHALKPGLWKTLLDAAGFTNPAGGEARAKLYASAILGEVKMDECEERVLKKRHQDSVRALGLVPLPEKPEARKKEVRRRYEVVQELRRGAHKFGAERRANEERAAALALDTLARNAGYADPIRMEWDLEAEAVRRLFTDAAGIHVQDLACELQVSSGAEAVLVIRRAGKELKTVPPELKKHAAFASLKEGRADLQTRCRRARVALEDFMVRRVTFTGTELRELMQHPLLAPLLSALVLVLDGKTGLPADDGKSYRGADGETHPLDPTASWLIAHPHDLLPAAHWAAWQSFIVRERIVQPFKQVFRELYVPVAGEDDDGTSRRYVGHTLKPTQALALIGQRGWLYDNDEGARKTLRHAGIVAALRFEEHFYTPGEVETITVADVRFERAGPGFQSGVALAEVPPVVFSEVMRDLDLMVSVAWTGQGEPQFTPATIGMRAALIQAVASALKLTNIQLTERHARIQGQLGSYRVHLGSAVALKSDSGMIWLSPVTKDVREPLFLPFADADPGAAEVLAKVLLLAQDHTIKNAELIRQLRGP